MTVSPPAPLPRAGPSSPAQVSSPLGHFSLSLGRRSPQPEGPARDRASSSPSPLLPRPPGLPAPQPRTPPRPLPPQASPRLAPSSPVFPSAGSPLPSLSPQPIPRPAPRARRSPADSPVLIQSGLAMLAMAKISAARKRHPEMMVSLSISPPRSPHPPSPGQAAASRLPPHGPPPGPGVPAPPPRAPSAPARLSRPPRARDQQPRRGPHSRNRRPPRNCSSRPPLTRKRSCGASEAGPAPGPRRTCSVLQALPPASQPASQPRPAAPTLPTAPGSAALRRPLLGRPPRCPGAGPAAGPGPCPAPGSLPAGHAAFWLSCQ